MAYVLPFLTTYLDHGAITSNHSSEYVWAHAINRQTTAKPHENDQGTKSQLSLETWADAGKSRGVTYYFLQYFQRHPPERGVLAVIAIAINNSRRSLR